MAANKDRWNNENKSSPSGNYHHGSLKSREPLLHVKACSPRFDKEQNIGIIRDYLTKCKLNMEEIMVISQ